MNKNWSTQFGRTFLTSPPDWTCPKCKIGKLTALSAKSIDEEHGWSIRAHGHDDWEPDWTSGVFCWLLSCTSKTCGHKVVVSGEATADWDIEETEHGQQQIWISVYKPTAFTDAPPIIAFPDSVPDNISKSIKSSFHLFWSDAPSCLNKIRVSIEEILTHEKIPRFSNKNSKRAKIPLHTRIENYRKKNSEVADLLMALKWLGNEGSHFGGKSKEIGTSDLLEAFSILEVCLDKIFDNKVKLASAKAKKINKRKGI